ncbi:hypothetical protein D3C80_2179340 [compost metagenome]
MLQNFGDVEEQRPLCLVREAVRAVQGILLGDASDRKRLARETGQQHVVRRNVLNGDLG